MQIEQQRDQGTLQPRTLATQHVKARSGDLDAALEIEDAELGPELPMGPRLERECARFALHAHLDVFGFVGADRHLRIG